MRSVEGCAALIVGVASEGWAEERGGGRSSAWFTSAAYCGVIATRGLMRTCRRLVPVLVILVVLALVLVLRIKEAAIN